MVYSERIVDAYKCVIDECEIKVFGYVYVRVRACF